MKIPPEPPQRARHRKFWSAGRKCSRKKDMDEIDNDADVMTLVGLDSPETGQSDPSEEKNK